MAWYTAHHLRYRGRLVSVGSRYGDYNGASVEKGQPLDLSYNSRDYKRLVKLFYRNRAVQAEIREFQDALNDYYERLERGY